MKIQIPFLVTIWEFIVSIFSNGVVWAFYMLSNTVIFLASLLEGSFAPIGAKINNYLIVMLDSIFADVLQIDIGQYFDVVDNTVLQMLGYTGFFEAMNVLSGGLVLIVGTYLIWILTIMLFKTAKGFFLGG